MNRGQWGVVLGFRRPHGGWSGMFGRKSLSLRVSRPKEVYLHVLGGFNVGTVGGFGSGGLARA